MTPKGKEAAKLAQQNREKANLEAELAKKRDHQRQYKNSENLVCDVQSEEAHQFIKAYQSKYQAQPNYQEPVKNPDGSITLSFSTPIEAGVFFLEMAKLNKPFVVIDAKTNLVMAYSNGDGKLYHGDGHEFQEDEKLTASTIPHEDFAMPAARIANKHSL